MCWDHGTFFFFFFFFRNERKGMSMDMCVTGVQSKRGEALLGGGGVGGLSGE